MTTEATRPDHDQTGTLTFPPGFRWGAATSAYQIEGAASEDGRGPSIWDVFAHTPGRTHDGDTGDVAADHYHRAGEDVELMARLGLGAYRFSVSWPRVQPAGRGPANPQGVAFYDRLVDRLVEHGIEPWITLYHWDLPQALHEAGGWPGRDVAKRFADYAELVYTALHDRVRHWTTMNEPWCAAFLGYASGKHAPGMQDPAASVRAAHHLLFAHGLALQAMRAVSGTGEHGIVLNLYPVDPATNDPRDMDAARRVDGLQNRLFLDPLLRGEYPADVLTDLAAVGSLAHIRDGDLAAIAAPLDLLGVNYYRRYLVAGGPRDQVDMPSPWPGAEHVRFLTQRRATTGMGWEIDPDGLEETLLNVHASYPRVPLAITENGAAFPDRVLPSGRIRDHGRIRFLDEHLRAVHRAIGRGVDLRGYFAWSLLDNFEWSEGYSQRFGVVHVDFATQRRLLKDSAHWYRAVIARHGLDGQFDEGGPG